MNAFFFIQTALESHGKIDRRTALALVTTNLERALGVDAGAKSPGREAMKQELVAYKGGDVFDLESKVVGVVSAERGVIELF